MNTLSFRLLRIEAICATHPLSQQKEVAMEWYSLAAFLSDMQCRCLDTITVTNLIGIMTEPLQFVRAVPQTGFTALNILIGPLSCIETSGGKPADYKKPNCQNDHMHVLYPTMDFRERIRGQLPALWRALFPY